MDDPNAVIFPIILEHDYDRLVGLIGVSDDYPATFAEWRVMTEKSLAKAGAKGTPTKQLVVDLEKYAAFCRAAGLGYNSTTLGAFAVADRWH